MIINKQKFILTTILILIIFFSGFISRFESMEWSTLKESEFDLYTDVNGTQYLQESDSYYNYRMTSNFLNNGYLGDELVKGIVWDSKSYYPPGVPLDYPPFIAWLAVSIYYLVNLFASVSLLEVCIWIPPVLSSLCGVIGFLFVRRFAGELGGFFTGMLLVTSNFFFLKTVPGFFDTDMFIIIFPLVIMWSLVEANQSNILKHSVILAALSGFLMFVFSLAWNGWQYFFYCILASFLLYFLIGKKKKWEFKHFYSIVLSFTVTCFILMALSYPLNIYKVLLAPLEYLDLFNSSANIWYPWPDTYSNVLELQDVPLDRYVYLIGPLAVILGLLGILITFLNEKTQLIKSKIRIGWFFYIILFVGTITSVLSLFKGVRFVNLTLPTLAISSGILVGIAYDVFKSSKINLNKNKKFIITFLFIMIMLAPQVMDVFNTSQSITPFYNDYYADSAYWINGNTSNDTVIITDWSYGHFYAAIADRHVSFDGRIGYIETLPVRNIQYASLNMSTDIPNTSRGYWIDYAFETNNYTLSRGIFTMLATSGDDAYLVLDQYTQNTTKSIEILKNILGIDKNSARILLMQKYDFSENEAKDILKYTHPTNPRPYVIIRVTDRLRKFKELDQGFKVVYQNKIIKIYEPV